MQYTYKKICSKEKDLVKNHIKKERDRLYKEQRVQIKGKDIRTEETSIGKQKLDQNQQQQMEKGKEEDMGFVSIAKNLGIQLEIVEIKNKELEKKEKSNKMSYQKRIEVSKLLAVLL